MRRLHILAILAATSCSTSPYADGPSMVDEPDLLGPNITEEIAHGEFFLGPEDTLRLDFWKHEDLNGDYKIRRNGLAYLPLVGPTEMVGITLADAQERLTAAYGEFLVDPFVYVDVEYSPERKVTVLGQVNNPTVLTLTNPRTSVLEVIAGAGEVVDGEGDKTAVLIARQVEGQWNVRPYDMQRFFAPSDPNFRGQVPYVQPGDVVYVLRTWQDIYDQHVQSVTDTLRGLIFAERVILNGPRTTDALQGDLGETTLP